MFDLPDDRLTNLPAGYHYAPAVALCAVIVLNALVLKLGFYQQQTAAAPRVEIAQPVKAVPAMRSTKKAPVRQATHGVEVAVR